MSLMCVIIGCVAGLLGAMPGIYLAMRAQRMQRPTVEQGLLVILISFIWMSFVLLVAKNVLECYFTYVSAACIATFLALWVAQACKAWCWMNQKSGAGTAEVRLHKDALNEGKR